MKSHLFSNIIYTLEAPESFNFSTISVIPGDSHNVCVDETLASMTMSTTVLSTASSSESMPVAPKVTYITVMERLNVAEAKKAGPFLDGCNVSLL